MLCSLGWSRTPSLPVEPPEITGWYHAWLGAVLFDSCGAGTAAFLDASCGLQGEWKQLPLALCSSAEEGAGPQTAAVLSVLSSALAVELSSSCVSELCPEEISINSCLPTVYYHSRWALRMPEKSPSVD